MTGYHEVRVFRLKPNKDGVLEPLLPDNWKPFSVQRVDVAFAPPYYEVVCRKWHRNPK